MKDDFWFFYYLLGFFGVGVALGFFLGYLNWGI